MHCHDGPVAGMHQGLSLIGGKESRRRRRRRKEYVLHRLGLGKNVNLHAGINGLPMDANIGFGTAGKVIRRRTISFLHDVRITRRNSTNLHNDEECSQGSDSFDDPDFEVGPGEERSVDKDFCASIFELVSPILLGKDLTSIVDPLLHLVLRVGDHSTGFLVDAGSILPQSASTEDIAGFGGHRLARRQFHEAFGRLSGVPSKGQSREQLEAKINDQDQDRRQRERDGHDDVEQIGNQLGGDV